MGKTTNIIYTVHSEIKQKTQTHKQKTTTKKQYKKKCLIKDYNFNYILTNLIKGEKCLLAIFHKRFLIYYS